MFVKFINTKTNWFICVTPIIFKAQKTDWSPEYYIYIIDHLAFAYFIFLIGIIGMIYNRKNFFLTMLSIEIMYLGLTLCFIIISLATADPTGQIYALILLVVAAAESAIGLGILIVLYRCSHTIEFSNYQDLNG